ncbi:hypothetical protein AMJ48_02850 [Parcubacteria bacterium DG_74_1]|nr:MAG: hypothetical protein AMJ48_02850 [Parcubacteria bacterium DG_74_1]
MQSIFLEYLSWHFLEAPKKILTAWKNFLRFGVNYFSITLLLRTLFSPWHKYSWTYPRGLYIGKRLEIFFSNLILRVLGAILRIFLIIFGVLAEIFIIFAGIIVFFGWLILPVLLIAGLVFGIKIIF